jgi:hypothetical protein
VPTFPRKQYTFVKLNSSGEAIAVAAATDVPIGVLQNAPTSGQEAEVLVVGGNQTGCITISDTRYSIKSRYNFFWFVRQLSLYQIQLSMFSEFM